MPGKPDYGSGATYGIGQYYPGSKEYRAWDEGWQRRYADGDLSKPNTTHPVGTAEYEADQAGWSEANTNIAGAQNRLMPYVYIASVPS